MINDDAVIIAARESLLSFTIATHNDYKINWHHKLIVKKLHDVAAGRLKRLIISMPPRHGKTELTSIRFAAWMLGNKPDLNVVAATYNSDFATDNSRKVRDLVNSDMYQSIFDTRLSKSAKAAGKWFTNDGGFYYSVGIGGGLTGRGANILLIDDPHKDRQEAESDVKRARVWDWFTSTAYTRLEKDAAIIVIMTRWHDDDLVGKLLAENEEWDYLCLPAIAEQDEEFRKEGDPLWKWKYDLEALKNIKETIGIRDWASLYQQRPVPLEGNIFKIEDWEFYDVLPRSLLIFQSWDTAFKTGKENDYSVCTTWAICENGYYMLHRYKNKVDFPTLKKVLMQLAEEFKPSAILIEDAASGQSIIQDLKSTRLPVIPVRVDKDKTSRAMSVTPLMSAKKVFLPQGKEWVRDFIDTLAYFPNGKHDDDVDSFTQAINWSKSINIKKDRINFSLGR